MVPDLLTLNIAKALEERLVSRRVVFNEGRSTRARTTQGGAQPPAAAPSGRVAGPDGLAQTWVVFGLCLLSSALGVAASLVVYGVKVDGPGGVLSGGVIAAVVLGITYGNKYSNVAARGTFTPMDFLQYLTQGFLWPGSWPSLAKLVGITTPIAPPK